MMFRKTTIAAAATAAAAAVTTLAFWSVDAVSAKEATTTTTTTRRTKMTSPYQNNNRALVGRTGTSTTNNDHHRRRLEQVAEDAGAEDANSQAQQQENHEYIQATACKAFAVESSSSSEDNNANGNDSNMDTTLMEQIYDWAGLETYRVKEQSYVFYDYDYAYGSSSSDENGDNNGAGNNNGAIDFDGNYVIDLQTWMKQMAYSVGGYDYGCRQIEDAYDLFGQDDADLQALASIDVSAYSQETGTNVDDLPSTLDTVYAGSICGMSSTTNGMFGGLFSSNENMILDGIFLDDSCSMFVPRLTYKYRRLLKQGKATSYDIMTAVSILTDYPLDCAQLGTCETLLESSMNSDTCTTFEEDMQSAAEEQEQQEQEQEQEQEQAQNDNNDAGANDGEQDQNNGNGGRRLRRMEDQQADDAAETTPSTLSYQISQYDIEQGFDVICSSIRASVESGTSLETVLSEHGQLQTSNGIDGLSPLGIGLIVGAVCFVLILLIMTVKIRKVKKVKSRRKNNQNDPDSKEEPLVDSSSSTDNDDDDRTEKMGDEVEEEEEEVEEMEA